MRLVLTLIILFSAGICRAQPSSPDICFFDAKEFTIYGFSFIFKDLASANAIEIKLKNAGSTPRRDGVIVFSLHPTREEATEDCLIVRQEPNLSRIEKISDR